MKLTILPPSACKARDSSGTLKPGLLKLMWTRYCTITFNREDIVSIRSNGKSMRKQNCLVHNQEPLPLGMCNRIQQSWVGEGLCSSTGQWVAHWSYTWWLWRRLPQCDDACGDVSRSDRRCGCALQLSTQQSLQFENQGWLSTCIAESFSFCGQLCSDLRKLHCFFVHLNRLPVEKHDSLKQNALTSQDIFASSHHSAVAVSITPVRRCTSLEGLLCWDAANAIAPNNSVSL